MALQYIYLLAILISAIITATVGVLGLQFARQSVGLRFFSPSLFLISLMQIIAIGISLSKGDENITTSLMYASYITLDLLVPCFAVFTMDYVGMDRWISGNRLYAIFIIPLITIIVILTNHWHGWMIKSIHYQWDGPLLYVNSIEYGPYFLVHAVFDYTLVFLTLVLLLAMAVRTFRIFRQQAIILILGILPLVFTSYLDGFLIVPNIKHFLSPLGFACLGVVLFVLVRSKNLLNVVPIARDKLIECMEDGMVVVNVEGMVLDINPAAQKMVKMPANRMVGAHISGLRAHLPELPALFKGKINPPVETALRGKGGEPRFVELGSNALKDRNERIVGRLFTLRDITRQKKLESELNENNAMLVKQINEINILHTLLQQQVIRDPLTGLLNRRYLGENLQKKPNHADPISCLMIDIDHFKEINDRYGHKAGDQILIAFAERLTKQVREDDFVYRHGGEEFLIIMPGISLDLAVERAETIRLLIGSVPFFIDEGPVTLSASIGAAAFPQHGTNMDKVIDQADAALYRAKAGGRNCVCNADIS